MSKRKWGESFLKSGLPLEHLTHVTFRELGWDCRPGVEFARRNRDGKQEWFELDLEATSPRSNRDTELAFLVECKYHDLSRYWMFLPHPSSGRWELDDRALNCAPFQTLKEPRSRNILDLAPLSSNGIVVAEDGTKQDNAVYAAVQQVVNGFVPVALMRMFQYNIAFYNVADDFDERMFTPNATALVPAIVTNARIFRLRPDVTDIDRIREADQPADIADELPWTWYFHDAALSLVKRNDEAIADHKQSAAELVHRFPGVAKHIHTFDERPNWIAVINIKHLSAVVKMFETAFHGLNTLPTRGIARPPVVRKRRRRLPNQ